MIQIHEEKTISKEFRINDKIRAREVSVIDEKGSQLGVLNLQSALDLARSRNVDLVEVSPTANPPVCKLLDFGRFKYEHSRKEREARKGQKALAIKEVWFRPNVDQHDLEVKMRLIQKFINQGDKVKVTVRMRGRELAHPERAVLLLDALAEQLSSFASIERTSQAELRTRTMIVAPLKSAAKRAQPVVTTSVAQRSEEPRPAV